MPDAPNFDQLIVHRFSVCVIIVSI
jgi:hypothetical protein